MLKLMPEATEAQRRTRLGTFGFGAEKADTACRKLSGGEKVRLLLALTAFHAPHFLILDEPTNHLDVDSREALIHALMNYNGAVILNQPRPASNRGDRRPALAGARRNREALRRPYGKLLRAAARRARRADDRGDSDAKATRTDQRRQAAERRAELAPLKKAMLSAEQRVEKLSKEIAALDVCWPIPRSMRPTRLALNMPHSSADRSASSLLTPRNPGSPRRMLTNRRPRTDEDINSCVASFRNKWSRPFVDRPCRDSAPRAYLTVDNEARIHMACA